MVSYRMILKDSFLIPQNSDRIDLTKPAKEECILPGYASYTPKLHRSCESIR